MQSLAAELRFEEAQAVKEKYDLIENFRARSEVVPGLRQDLDVFNIESEENVAFINFLHVTEGCINQAFTFEYKKKLDESDEELLRLGIIEMRGRGLGGAKEIVLPFPVALPEEYATVTVPLKGEKKKLLDLSALNVKQYKFDRLKQAEKLDPSQKNMRLMKEIQQQLALPTPPLRIELFDNSNIQGEDAVAACVVFERLKPCKKDYRKYIIKTVQGPDDYASMAEVVYRRYKRLKEENGTLPNLIIADGGKGQMEIIRKVVEDELELNIPIAGLAKNDRHKTRELLYGFPPQSICLKPESQLFRTLSAMQEEVHRFAISFHREKRSARQTASELDNIPGIGPKLRTALLQKFKSVKRIKEAPLADLQSVVGAARGQKIFDALHATQSE